MTWKFRVKSPQVLSEQGEGASARMAGAEDAQGRAALGLSGMLLAVAAQLAARLDAVLDEVAGLRADIAAVLSKNERQWRQEQQNKYRVRPDPRDRSDDAGYDASGSGGAAVVRPEEG
jgi:hypothetical protein